MDSRALDESTGSREQRERLHHLIVENAPVGIVSISPDGYILSANPFLCRMLGYSPSELCSMQFKVLEPTEQQARHAPLSNRLLAGEIQHLEREIHLIRKDGSVLTGFFHVNLVRDPQGEPELFVGQLEDITKRRAAEEQLRHREQMLDLTFEKAPIGMSVVEDLSGSFTRVNAAFARLLGYSQKEFENLSVADITHPEDIAATRLNMQRLWDGKADEYSVEKRFIRKDGRVITCISRVGMVRDTDGNPLLTIGQVLDITDKVAAATELEHMRNYLSQMIDSMPSMLIAVDVEGRVTQWNEVAAQSTGIAAAQAIGRQADELLPFDDEHKARLKETLSMGKPAKAERLALNFKGEPRIIDALVYPLISDRVIGAAIRLDDVSDKVRMQEMLVQTEKMLSVGGLAAGMAHEINNPLGSILQGCQNIQRRLSGDLPANRKVAEELGLDLSVANEYLARRNILQFLERIQEAGARAAKIVSDMLSFSRRSELHFQPIDLAELLDKAVRLASSDFDLKQDYDIKLVQFERDFDPALGPVQCDRTEIEQVVLNLIVNAAQAMASNPGEGRAAKITLRTRLAGNHAQLEVIDNGPGMSEETRRRIFEPFYTTKEVGVGTGLGLSVSYFIIYDQHKGSMQVESAPGKGARFIIRLPLRQE